MRKIIFCAHSNYEYFLSICILEILMEKNKGLDAHIICPPNIKKNLPVEWKRVFTKVYGIELPRVSFSFLSDIRIANNFRKFIKKFSFEPDLIFCVAWRSTANNILAKKFASTTRMVSCVNGYDPNPKLFKNKLSLKTIYRYAFDFFYGHSHIIVSQHVKDKNVSYVFWKKSPINCVILFGDNKTNVMKQDDSVTNLVFPIPKFLLQRNNKRKTLLFIGERTPLFQQFSESQNLKYQNVIDTVVKKFDDWTLFFKPRKHLTDVNKLNLNGFNIVNSDAPLEYEICRLKPNYIISAKSTFSKVAWWLNIPCAVFYPLLDLDDGIMDVLDDFFSDVPNMPRLRKLEELHPKTIIRNEKSTKIDFDRYHSVIFDEK